MDVETSKAKKEAKSKAATKVKRGNLMAAKRGIAPKLDTAAIQKTIQTEAKKLAVKMVAAAQNNGKGGKGGKKGKAVKISFRAADLKKNYRQECGEATPGHAREVPQENGCGEQEAGWSY